MPRFSTMILLVLLAAMLVPLAPLAWSDVLIGNYQINGKYNCGGCAADYNPYFCVYLSPGPVHVDGLAPGRYRILVTAIGPNGASGVFVWLGDANSGTYFPINSPNIVGSTTEFFHNGGNMTLYWHDWYPWDNDPLFWTDVQLDRMASFESTLQNIGYLLYQGLIDSKGVANSLSAKIQAAAAAAGRGQSHVWRNQVEAFKHEVEAQADKHIMGIAVQTLLVDADSLLSQSL